MPLFQYVTELVMTRPALKEFGIQSFIYSLLLTGKQLYKSCVISSFRRGVNEIFALLGCYAAYTGSYRRFGITYRSHLQGSEKTSTANRLKTETFEPITG